MTAKRLKTLIIGLDGATFDIIRPLVEEGSLPVLAKLIAEGSSGELETVFPPITATAWSSFFTGKNPGKHGIYDFLYRSPNQYSSSPNNRLTRKAADFWNFFNQQGFSVGIVNAPMTYPPESIDGYMITGIMTPRAKNIWKLNFTAPESLKEELKKAVGTYMIYPKIAYRKDKAKAVYEELLSDLRMKSKTVQFLLQEHTTDIAMFVIGGTDKILHDLYHLLDSNHPYYDPQEAIRDRHFIKDYFIQVDRELGVIIDGFCDEQTLIVVMSDHGMGPLYKWVHLNAWLLKEGYLQLKNNLLTNLKKFFFDMGITPSAIYQFLLKLGFSKSRVSFEARDKLITKLFLSWDDIDWKRSRAYSRGHVGQIFINKKGREPQGIVSQEDYGALKAEIEAKLLSLQDGGVKLVEKILDAQKIYWGPYREQAPDIVFMPKALEYMALGTSAFISNKVAELCFGCTGNHRMNGIIIMKGKGLRKGYQIKGARIIDIVPNLLFYYNLPLEKEMDGGVLADIYDSDFFQSRSIKYSDYQKDTACEVDTAYSQEEAESVKKALKDLGYFG